MYSENYAQLTRGQQNKVRQKFIYLFDAHRVTFYRKISGKLKLRPIEKHFFDKNLLHSATKLDLH